jgi:hypothetical protein
MIAGASADYLGGNPIQPHACLDGPLGGVGMGASIAAVCREAPSSNIVRETLNEQGWDDGVPPATVGSV